MSYACQLPFRAVATAQNAHANENSHLPEMPVDADSLLHAINRELWMPNTGCYPRAVGAGSKKSACREEP